MPIADSCATGNIERAKATKAAEAAHNRECEAERSRARARRIISWGSALVAALIVAGALNFAAREQRPLLAAPNR